MLFRSEIVLSKTNSVPLRFTIYSVQPFKPVFYATVKHMQEQVVCEIGPDGRSFSAFESTKLIGTALGIGFEEYLELRISALTPLR